MLVNNTRTFERPYLDVELIRLDIVEEVAC